MRRFLLLFAILLAALGAFSVYWYLRPLPKLAITTWPGEYGHAQRTALIEPYRDIAQWTPAQCLGRRSRRDFARRREPHLQGRCDRFRVAQGGRGLPRRLAGEDRRREPAHGRGRNRSGATILFRGAIGDCWVGSVVYSQVILFAKSKFAGAHPTTLADFFDTGEISGPRALKRRARNSIWRWRCLADGVAPKNIYKTLVHR